MTSPPRIMAGGGQADSQEQSIVRAFVTTLHSAVRAVRLYPIENVAVQKAVAELTAAVERVVTTDGQCGMRRIGDYLFVNETRLRLTLDNFTAVTSVMGLLSETGLGGFSVVGPTTPRDWMVLLGFLQSPPPDLSTRDAIGEIDAYIRQRQVSCFQFLPVVEESDQQEAALDAKERAQQTYARSLAVTRDIMTSARLGRSVGLKRVKRAVQGIVDAILTDPASLIGLTTLREFDEYTFVHSVNVSILSVALGRRLGLRKVQLLDLGLAALLHDMGKSRIPLEVLNKRGAFDGNERAFMQSHTWQGVLAIFSMPTGAERPWRAMTTAYEHHMRIDMSGYPRPLRSRELMLFTKIISVADGFDAATSRRVYQTAPWSPADVLQGMRDDPRHGVDPVVVKAFINMMGVYPVGTVVVLDSSALAIVMAANPDPTALSRPLVRLITDARGNRLLDSHTYDLTARDASGQFERTIIRTEDAKRYGINLRDYFS